MPVSDKRMELTVKENDLNTTLNSEPNMMSPTQKRITQVQQKFQTHRLSQVENNKRSNLMSSRGNTALQRLTGTSVTGLLK
jgi:DNA gyrase/topoisomerase IV subunit A